MSETKSLTLADLKFEGKNPRRRTQRGLGQLEDSLQQIGAWRSIAADENLNVIAGRGTCEAAANVGINRVKRVDADGNELVVVVRHGLSEQQKKEYMVRDNRTAELAEWAPEVVKEFSEEVDLKQQFYDGELKKLYGESGSEEEKIECPTCGRRYKPS